MPPFLHVGQPGLDEASSRVSKTLEAAESSMSDLGMMNKATSDSGTQLRHAQSAPLRLQGFEAEEYYVRNLHSKGGEMMERLARKFHLLHSLQAQALLDELRLDKQLIAARRSGTAHFIERRSVLHHVVHLARRANKEYVAFTRTLSGPLRLESCPCEIEKYYVQDFHNENMKKRIARKFHLLHSKQMELANFMNIAELVSPKSRLG
mmetsp:Transcript_35861/g.57817  ORF Transcript_35861/g.57817 Transcript_35861/m.57817 type:complete len:207 (-) Transcript_35861:102-722(-)